MTKPFEVDWDDGEKELPNLNIYKLGARQMLDDIIKAQCEKPHKKTEWKDYDGSDD